MTEVKEIKREVMNLPCKSGSGCESVNRKAGGLTLMALLLVGGLFFQSGCGTPDLSQHALRITANPSDCGVNVIAGGETETGEEALARVFGGGGCSGVLIDPWAVLTAAHCVSGDALTVNIWGAQHVVERVVIHPTADLAIVILAEPALNWMNKPIKPLTVYVGPLDVGDHVKIVGWGRKYRNTPEVQYPTSGRQEVFDVNDTDIIYAGLPGLCDGDSGGPTLYGRCVAGIHRSRIGECGDESIDTRLALYGSWIKEVLS